MPVTLLCLFQWKEDLPDFRLPEVMQVANTLGKKVSVVGDTTMQGHQVHQFMQFESVNDAVEIADRCVLLRAVFEPWADADNYDQLFDLLKQRDHLFKQAFGCREGVRFKYHVECFGRGYPNNERLGLIKRFECCDHYTATVDLVNPDVTLWILEDIGHGTKRGDPLQHVYFGREIHQTVAMRKAFLSLALPQRKYLGTTSMPADISFLMANMAQVNKGDLVIDPFCGTASILTGCAYLGAKVFGSELDSRVLAGKDGNDIFSNFAQYSLPEPELLRGDMSRRFFWRNCEMFDAIVTDPPYGSRAGSRKVNKTKMAKIEAVQQQQQAADKTDPTTPSKEETTVAQQQQQQSGKTAEEEEPSASSTTGEQQAIIVPTIAYTLSDMLVDLLDFAAKMLRVGGIVTFWLPTTEQYTDAELASHDCFTLLYNTQQPLTIRLKRRLVTMKKIKPWTGQATVRPSVDVDIHNNLYYSNQYTDYKQKVQKKRDAKKKWCEEHGINMMTVAEKRRVKRQQEKEAKKAKPSKTQPP
eukprot:TRINITY_DN66572_c0_g4_i1.p1 TRINITY_DN66572_c0_g4~~TRINITY_DN66572_c0_g4_i1.p1  ORF type:complete len:527 (+),score=61.52 TRINITY_DN66572_c0_g4_i1:40-1620(+)